MQRTAGIRSLVPGSDPSRRSFRGAALLGTLKNPIILCETAKLGVLENDVQQRDRQTDRQTDKQPGSRQAGGRAGGRADGQTGRQTDRPTDRQTNRRTHTATHTHTDCHTHMLCLFYKAARARSRDQGSKGTGSSVRFEDPVLSRPGRSHPFRLHVPALVPGFEWAKY